MDYKIIKKIIFIGGNRYAEDGPLLSFIEECKSLNIDYTVITDQIHLDYPTANYGKFKDALLKLQIPYISSDLLDYSFIDDYILKKKIDKMSINPNRGNIGCKPLEPTLYLIKFKKSIPKHNL